MVRMVPKSAFGSPSTTLPATLPGGGLTPFMSAARRSQVADMVFEAAGGAERLARYAQANDAQYWQFIKDVWVKGLPRISSAEIDVGGDGLEALVDTLRAGAAKDVTDAAQLLDIPPDALSRLAEAQ